MAGGLADGGVDVTVVDVAAAPVDLPADFDLLVVGAPTHAFSLSRPSTRADAVRKGAALERAATGSVSGWAPCCRGPGASPVAAVFDTRVVEGTTAARRPPDRAPPAWLGGAADVLGRPEAFLVADIKGPLVVRRGRAGRRVGARAWRPRWSAGSARGHDPRDGGALAAGGLDEERAAALLGPLAHVRAARSRRRRRRARGRRRSPSARSRRRPPSSDLDRSRVGVPAGVRQRLAEHGEQVRGQVAVDQRPHRALEA